MLLNASTWIWLFPLAFILHDLEELILFEPWLAKNAGSLRAGLQDRLPAFLQKQLNAILQKTTRQFAVPISLIFLLTCAATILAAVFGKYSFFLLASSLFFLHGFMHIGQAVLLRRYVPALISSALIVLPYGAVLFWRLLAARIVDLPILLIYFLIGSVLAVPFILGMHLAGEILDQKVFHRPVGQGNG
jgi:hypothetical protein